MKKEKRQEGVGLGTHHAAHSLDTALLRLVSGLIVLSEVKAHHATIWLGASHHCPRIPYVP